MTKNPSSTTTHVTPGLSLDDLTRLRAPLPLTGHSLRVQRIYADGTRAHWLTYVEEDAVIDRLNNIDPGWSLRIVTTDVRSSAVIVYGTLTVKGVRRDGVGTNSIRDGNEHDAAKGAATDLLKRLGRLFGIGLYLKRAPAINTDWAVIERGMSAEERKRCYTVQDRAEQAAWTQFVQWYRATFPDMPIQDRDLKRKQAPPPSDPAPAADKSPAPAHDMNQEWQDIISDWTRSDWYKFWSFVRDRLGKDGRKRLHDHLQVKSMKDFTGTRGDVYRALDALGDEGEGDTAEMLPGESSTATPATASDENSGTFVIGRAIVKPPAGGKPRLYLYELDFDGQVADSPTLYSNMYSAERIRSWFGQPPRSFGGEDETIFDFERDGEVLLAHWISKDNARILINISAA